MKERRKGKNGRELPQRWENGEKMTRRKKGRNGNNRTRKRTLEWKLEVDGLG